MFLNNFMLHMITNYPMVFGAFCEQVALTIEDEVVELPSKDAKEEVYFMYNFGCFPFMKHVEQA